MAEPISLFNHKNLHPLLIPIADMFPTDLDESQAPILVMKVLDSL